MLAQTPRLTTGLVEAVEDLGGDSIYAPALLGNLELPGIRLHLGPSAGVLLREPVSVHIPLASLGATAGDDILVLLNDGGRSEVAPSQIVGDELWVDVAHFSWLDFILPSSLDRILDNAWDNPWSEPGDYAEALRLVESGPLAAGLVGFNEALCLRSDLRFDTTAMTSLFDLLNGLFVGTAGARGGSTRTEALANRIRAYGGENSVMLGTVFQEALDLTDGDVFQALALSHDVLSVNQRKPSVQGPVQNVLPPGQGLDQVGGRYHVLGSAVYSFMYEHAKTTGTAGWFAPSPSSAVLLEEAWVSGDIREETHEFVLDNKGVELGRRVFDLWYAKTGRGTTAQRATYRAFCGEDANSRFGVTIIEPPGGAEIGEAVTLRIEAEGGYEPNDFRETPAYVVSVRDQSKRVDLGTVLVPYRGGQLSSVDLRVVFDEAGGHVLRATGTDSVGSMSTDTAFIEVVAPVRVPPDCERIGRIGVDIACSRFAKTAGDLTLVYVEFENQTTQCFSDTPGLTSSWTAEHRGEIRYTRNVDALQAQINQLNSWRFRFNLTCLGFGYQDVTWTVTPIVGGISQRYADALLSDIADRLSNTPGCQPFGWPDCELANHGSTGTMNERDAT